MSRKANIGRTVNYLFKEASKLEKGEQKPIIIRRNLRTRKLEKMVKEFEANEALRKCKRKDAIKLYHTVVSFHAKDTKHLSEKTFRDIAREYMKLKGENLYVATVHFDKGHQHLHIVESGTGYMTGKANRVSKKEFRELKVALQTYQQTKYPELSASIVKHEKTGRGKQKAISDRQGNKQSLLKLLEKAEQKSKTLDEFLSAIRKAGHEPYYRGEKLAGIKYDGDTKFRFSRLGYDKDRLEQLSRAAHKELEQLQELEDLRSNSGSRDHEERLRSKSEEEENETIDDNDTDYGNDDDYSRE